MQSEKTVVRSGLIRKCGRIIIDAFFEGPTGQDAFLQSWSSERHLGLMWPAGLAAMPGRENSREIWLDQKMRQNHYRCNLRIAARR